MPFYRVIGLDGTTGDKKELFIESSRLLHALSTAGRHGVHDADGEEFDEQNIPGNANVIRKAEAGERGGSSQRWESDLLRAPIMTIAKGVFLGLLFWALFVVLIMLLISILTGLGGIVFAR